MIWKLLLNINNVIMKVNAIKLNSASVMYTNAVDAERVFDIEANVNLEGSDKVVSVDGGVVKKDGVLVASFSTHGSTMNHSLYSVTDVMEMYAILTAISGFVTEVKNEVTTNPMKV